MQANPRKLTELFGQTLRYMVPIFQRHYVWDEENQWIPLWEDILEKHKQRLEKQSTSEHFLGAIILDQVRKQSTKEVSRFVVIDGQQRITTIQLLLASLRDFVDERGFHDLANAVGGNLFNPFPEMMEDRSKEIYKLWPTKFNRDVFCNILNASSYEKVNETYPIIFKPRKRKPEPRDRLVDAYVFFYTNIKRLCEDGVNKHSEEDILLELYGVLQNNFAVVEIILSEQDDSQEIFNSLNALGKPLNQSDLLRSFIFMRAEKSHEDLDSLYDKYWGFFEDNFWDVQTRRGNLWSSRLDQVTRIFLSSKIGVAVDAKKVHIEYKNWVREKQPFSTIEDELKAFFDYGNWFYLLEEPIDIDEFDKFAEFARRLKIWDVTTVYPLVIFLIVEAKVEWTEFLECCRTLEAFIVRRLICRKDNKEYNKYFIEIISRLRQEGPSLSALKKLLATGSGATRAWPNDQEFEYYWCSEPVYDYLDSAQIRTIFKLIELHLRTTKTEDVSLSSISVEHIMPQDWAEHYPLDGKLIPWLMYRGWYSPSDDHEANKLWDQIEDKVMARNKAIQSFGNLTIVTQPLNSKMSNAAFIDKKKEFRNSVLLLNRYLDYIRRWDEVAMAKRARKLFDTAKTIWFGP